MSPPTAACRNTPWVHTHTHIVHVCTHSERMMSKLSMHVTGSLQTHLCMHTIHMHEHTRTALGWGPECTCR